MKKTALLLVDMEKSGFAEPINAEDAKQHAPKIFMLRTSYE